MDGLTPFIRNVTTPVLAANLLLDRVPELQNEKNLKKSIVINVNGVSVGIIGYVTPDTKFLAPKNDVEYEDEVVAIQREVDILQSHGVDILIALGHSGYITDLKIAQNVKGLDLVIGGHSNTFLLNGNNTEKPERIEGPYPKMVDQASGKMVPVVQAYAYTKYLGRLHLIFDAKGEIIHLDGAPILLEQNVPEDPDIIEIVKKYKKDMDRVSSEEVGSSLVLLDGDCRLRQCNIGNLITDAILDYTKKMKDICANIAIVQGGRIRTSIDRPQKPFIMNRGDWFSVIPFTDTLTVLTMNGTILLEALEHAIDGWRIIDTPGQFLQFSGMEVVYDLAKPVGSRVVSAKAIALLKDDTCEETVLMDIEKDMRYRVIMPTFLAEGGDGYKMFESLPTETAAYSEIEPTITYLGKNSPVNPLIDERLTIINEDRVDSLLVSPTVVSNRREGKVLRKLAHSGAIITRSSLFLIALSFISCSASMILVRL